MRFWQAVERFRCAEEPPECSTFPKPHTCHRTQRNAPLSPSIARLLRERGRDVQAVKRDRPDLESLPDCEIVRIVVTEKRAVVTNNVIDFQPIHDRILASGEIHFGMLFTSDETMPRTKSAILLWVNTLDDFLRKHPDEEALRNRVYHLR